MDEVKEKTGENPRPGTSSNGSLAMVQRYVKNQGHENAGRELQASRAVPGKRTIPGFTGHERVGT